MMQELYMLRALELAKRGSSEAAPNPMVGAVLVHEDRIIGEGWHQRYGAAHAEVACLASVTEADRHLISRSTMYVNLEPCAHWGKTPPCAGRLVQEQVQEVVIANVDPFAQVAGKGIRILEEAGIAVRTGLLETAGTWLNRRFFCFHRQQRPYIILKWAASSAGFLAPEDQSRLQLSNAFSNQWVHEWRTREAAILVGYNTALHDNPQLTARHYPGPQPLRIVLDRNLQLPRTHHLFDDAAMTWIVNDQREADSGSSRFIRLPFGEELLPELLQHLYRHHRLSLIVEGGAALLTSFIRAGLWDEARIFRTEAPLSRGIAAPVPAGGRLADTMALAGDRMELWINAESQYPYVSGTGL